MPFVDGFPERLIREGLPARLKRNDVNRWNLPHPPLDQQINERSGQRLLPPQGLLFHDSGHYGGRLRRKNMVTQKIDTYPSEHLLSRNSEIVIPENLASLALENEEDTIDNFKPDSPTPLKRTNTELDGSVQISEMDSLLAKGKQVNLDVMTNLDVKLEMRSETIHILGSGRMGKFVAHSIAAVPFAPPVAMLIHRPFLLDDWRDEGGSIKVIRDGKINVQSGIKLEAITDISKRVQVGDSISNQVVLKAPNTWIDNLVVTTDSHATIPALTSVKSRIRPSSTVCFMGDGLGVIDVVNSKVFPDPAKRPNYALANITHMIAPTLKRYTVQEIKVGKVSFTILPRDVPTAPHERLLEPGSSGLVRRMEGRWGPFRHTMRSLSRAPELNVKSLRTRQFYTKQLEKMVVNSIIGPLTVMFDCSNDQLLHNYAISQAMEELLKEMYDILCELPEIHLTRQDVRYFNPRSLKQIIVSTIIKTKGNTSDMLQAVRNGQRTGIEYYNGYFVRRAEELGLSCVHNKMMISLVTGKQHIIVREKESYIPTRRDVYKGV